MNEENMKREVRKKIKGGDVVVIKGEEFEVIDFYPHGALTKKEKGAKYFFQWFDLLNVKEA